MSALLTVLAPLLVELIKIFFGGNSSEKEKAAAEIKDTLRRIRVALDKAKQDDSTQDIEDIINKR